HCWRQVLTGVLGRLILVPVLLLPTAIMLGFRGLELAGLLALFASPSAVSSFTMAKQMDGDSELAGQLVVYSSAFSILTMFLWIVILRQGNYI
ncbi:MAG TPA: AEC family transporter, partial [Peptococcaceae bacterium]|nr:AEC family transporter [Peptococcaceae bacterium]